MDNFAKFLLLLWTLFFLIVLFNIYKYFKYKKSLKKLKSQPLDYKYKTYLNNLPLYKNLPSNLKKIIEYKIQRFWLEKNIIPVYLTLSDEIKTLIAFYGCILTIGYEEYCYPRLQYIYIYPKAIKKTVYRDYIVENDVIISGEALKDSVIISWHDAKYQIYKHSKRNVIIHEFAHILDFDDGVGDGIPPLDKDEIKNWKKYILSTYNRLKKHKQEIFIDEYALTNESEFFAVISEYYFTSPKTLIIHYPELYSELKKFYKIDTFEILKNS